MDEKFLTRKVATKVVHELGWTKVFYHKTCIVAIGGEEIILNTGGYFTVTIRRRMNQVSTVFNLPIYVYQENKQWHVVNLDTHETIPFMDGMKIPNP